jgi:hypothetical protein
MKPQKLLAYGLLHAIAIFFYVLIVVLIMNNGERLFGRMNNITGPLALLLLFVLSAAVVGSLVLLKPAMIYLDGKKKEALSLLGYTIGALAVVTAVVFFVTLIFG